MDIDVLLNLLIENTVKDGEHAFDLERFGPQELLAEFRAQLVVPVPLGGRVLGPLGHLAALVRDLGEITHVEFWGVVGGEEGSDEDELGEVGEVEYV